MWLSVRVRVDVCGSELVDSCQCHSGSKGYPDCQEVFQIQSQTEWRSGSGRGETQGLHPKYARQIPTPCLLNVLQRTCSRPMEIGRQVLLHYPWLNVMKHVMAFDFGQSLSSGRL